MPPPRARQRGPRGQVRQGLGGGGRRRRPDKPSLVRACLVGSGPTLIYTGILYIIAQATLFSGPVLLRLIVEALECRARRRNCPSNQDLYYYAMYLTLAGVVQNLCQAQQDYTMQRLGVRVRNRLMCALYRKVLRLSPWACRRRPPERSSP